MKQSLPVAAKKSLQVYGSGQQAWLQFLGFVQAAAAYDIVRSQNLSHEAILSKKVLKVLSLEFPVAIHDGKDKTATLDIAILARRGVPLAIENEQLEMLAQQLLFHFSQHKGTPKAGTRQNRQPLQGLHKQHYDETLNSIRQSRHISEEQRRTLAFLLKDGIAEADIDALLNANSALRERTPAWEEFVLGLLFDYYYQRSRLGHLTVDDEITLLQTIEADHRVDERTELLLLIEIVRRAEGISAPFYKRVLELLRDSVLHSDTPLFTTHERRKGSIDPDDVIAIRRVIYGMGGCGGNTVSRQEADFLFDLEHDTRHETNCNDWHDFFGQAIASHLLLGSNTLHRITPTDRDWLHARLATEPDRSPAENNLLKTLKQEAGFIL